MTSQTGASSAAPGEPARSGLLAGRPWAAVGLLMSVIILNLLDRSLPAILAEPIKRDLGLSDTFLGVLNGVGFLTAYGLASFPMARIADRGRYGAVISFSVALWSALTGLGGLVGAGWQLALTRIGVGVGEAGNVPASHAYVSRNFAPARRTAALAVLSLGQPLGGMAGLVAGGLLGQGLGWRGAFLTMGVIGLALAPIVLLALGAAQHLPPRSATVSLAEVGLHLRKRTVVVVVITSCIAGVGGYAAAAFAPAFLIRAHGMSVAAAGLQLGLLNGAVGVASLLGVSSLGARLSRRDPRWSLGVLALLFAGCTPFGLAAYQVSDGWTSLVCISLSNTAGTAYLALTVACLHSLVPAEMRAQTSSVLLLLASSVGGLGPLITGMISDALAGSLGPAALGRALLVQPICFALASLGFLAAAITLRADLSQARPYAD
jgi:MFS family permease